MTNPLNQYTAITQAAFTLNPTVDLNGSTLNDGRTVSTWDERNQRRSVTQTATGEQLFSTFDAVGRRIKEQELSASNSELRKTRYLFDGWNCVAEFAVTPVTAALVRKKTHTWGLDLSQTPQGAGGVGGLLATVDETAAKAVYTFAYDGNGNVAALYTNSFGFAASYDYDPFGKTISASGSYAAENKYRFSTKPQDRIGGLYYYGYRYYDPVTGRWPSRDPIGERGGVNLYGMVRNRSVNSWDYLGLSENETRCCDAETIAKGKAELEKKYKKAYDQFKSQDTQPGGVNAQSCKNISGAVLPALDPVPKCWTCKEEAGATNWSPFASDHQWVTCKSHPKDGREGEEIAFDYWGGNTGSVPAGNIRNKYDNPQEADVPGTVRHNTCDRTNPTGEGYGDGLDGVRDIPPTPNPMPQPNPPIIPPGY